MPGGGGGSGRWGGEGGGGLRTDVDMKNRTEANRFGWVFMNVDRLDCCGQVISHRCG